MSKQIEFKGFNRVVINHHGEALSMPRAEQVKIFADVGFMRADGWSLGAPNDLEAVAYDMWRREWTHFVTKGDEHWRPISDYRQVPGGIK